MSRPVPDKLRHLTPLFGQIVMLLMAAASVVSLRVIGIGHLDAKLVVSVYMDTFLVVVMNLLFFGCLRGNGRDVVTRVLMRMIFIVAADCFLDMFAMTVDGIPAYIPLNILSNTLLYCVTTVLSWTLWNFLRVWEQRDSRQLHRGDKIVACVSVLELVLTFFNLFFHFFFYVDETGVYHHAPTYFISVAIVAVTIFAIVIAASRLRLKPAERIIFMTYPMYPFLGAIVSLVLLDGLPITSPLFGFSMILIYSSMYVRREQENTQQHVELNVAADIQSGVLPHDFPVREEFALSACMYPAKEVGGDFYDFFYPDAGRLVCVIADVSGKGVPSALFMMRAKTLFKTIARYETEPGVLMSRVNDALCADNEADYFVTAWLGILEIPTGRLSYCSAGHNPPILTRNGVQSRLRGGHGPVLGYVPGMQYKQDALQMGRNDRLFLYTDGVTEAHNAADAMYGEDRLAARLGADSDCSPDEVLRRVKESVDAFCTGAAQFDDITMMLLQYKKEV